ncbi:MAG: Ig-like domain repeat protein [Pyrinomonadaceae bacterium]|nr:Ig-like domain repeat protein [Pyrinomonadaceae bacterium]
MIVLIQLPAVSLAYKGEKNSFFNQKIDSIRSEIQKAGQTGHSNLTAFSNSTAITVADRAGTSTPNGIATPYPSAITVSGLAGTVSDVNVTITGITTNRERDLNFALVAPNGAALMLLGDGGDLFGMSNVNLTFDDSAAALVPSTAISSGTYKPTDYLFSATDSDDFPSPGPATFNTPAPEGIATLASAFNGISPNGNWNLFIVDDSLGGGTSSVSGGWSIDVTTNAVVQGTNTSIASNINPALTTQTITFTSTTTLSAGGAPVTSGTVAFTNNGSPIAGCSNSAVDGSGNATCMTTLPEGTRSISANYSGTATFGISSGSLSQVINSPTVQTGGQFCNNGGFTIADPGTGSVYPSNISVSGLIGTIAAARVKINGLTAPRPSNLDFMLVGANGQAFQFMSDVGDSVNAVSNINLTVDDAASGLFPIGTALSGGTYRPTDFSAVGETDPYPAPAPAAFNRAAPQGTSTFNSIYASSNPNGNWTLYSVDDGIGGGVSTVASWCVDFTLNKIGTSTTLTSTPNPSNLGQNVTFTATVTAASGIPTGNVEFFDGATSLGTGALVPTTGTSAAATLSTNALPAGVRSITAVYAGTTTPGGGGFNTSTSTPLSQNVIAGMLSINDVSASEGNSGTTNFNFIVTLSQVSSQTVTVNYATANGTAVAPGDYGSASGTLTFAPGDTTKTITVVVNGDTTVEPNENFFVNLSGATNATISDNQGIGTIQNDDFATVSINGVAAPEGNSGSSNFTFTVMLSQPSSQTITMDFSTANGTAVAPGDYTANSGSISFNPGETSKTISVSVNGDTTVESDETFFVNLTNVVGATVLDGQGQGTIQNDDIASISINDVSASEGNSGTTDFTFTVNLSQPSLSAVTVNYATANGSAIAGSDYTSASGTVTFNAGETSKTITVSVLGDTVVEPNENFFVNLSGAVNATISDNQGLGTIQNDDTATIAIGDVTLNEGNSGTTAFVFSVSLTNASASAITVDYSTANGSATSGSDYTAASGTLTFAAGETSKTVTVNVSGDVTVEPNETFFVNLSNASGAVIGDNQGLGTILNDDTTALSISDVSLNEGNSGTTTFGFTVSLTNPSATAVTVNYATADGTALISDGDYQAVGSTILTFNPGETSKTVNILVNGDNKVEPNETFFVNLTNASGATISDNQGLGTIQNDDATALSINDVSLNEGNSGTTAFNFTVSLTNPSASAITVDYATANGTANSGSDYTAVSGTLTFSAGETTKIVTVNVSGDTLVEPNETFFVNLSNASGAPVSDNQGLGSIQNDDTTAMSIGDVSLVEGNAGTTSFIFSVSLTNPSSTAITVDYATAAGTVNPATAGTDYTAASGTITFNPGETSKSVGVSVNGDNTVELDETFFVNLSNLSGASVSIADGQGMGTIINDDIPTFSINDVTQNEGNSGTTSFTFTVNLSQANPAGATVTYATADGTATVAGNDYTAIAPTVLNFGPADTQKTVTVLVTGDTNVELDETFFVNLTGATNATISDNQGQGTILNDDTPAISINDVTVAEGNSGTTLATFTVSLSQTTNLPVSVQYATADGTATAFTDYVGLPLTTLNFAPGETTKQIAVTVNGDTEIELNETFFVNLSNPVNATIADNQGIGTIENDDAPVLSINDITQDEGSSGPNTFNFTVTLSPASVSPVTVKYSTADGTATSAGGDYTAITTPVMLTFAPGETTKTASVTVNGDTTVELDETFFVNLTMPTGAIVLDPQGSATIRNDDTPTLSIDDVSQVEGNTGTSNFAFTITLSQPSPLDVTVSYATAVGTTNPATPGEDYTAIALTPVTFLAGETTKTVNVSVNGDTTTEFDETFFVDLSSPINATIADGQGVGTIQNDDVPAFTITDVSMNEGNSGTTNFVFTVTLSQANPAGASVAYTTNPGSGMHPATPGADYTTTAGTLTFGAAETSKTITVPVIGDLAAEFDETFVVDLSSPTGATISDNQGDGTIVNDDIPTLSVNTVRQLEGNSGTSLFNFTITLSQAHVVPVTVSYKTEHDSATSSDYVPIPLTAVTFAVGETTKNFSVTVFGDTIREQNEVFRIILSNAANATIANNGAGVIIDEEAFSISDFDGDRVSDYSVYRPSTGVWYSLQSTNGVPLIQTFGLAGDLIAPGDYDGDGKTDRAFFRPSTGNWHVLRSSDSGETITQFGMNGDKPVQGDFDNDGKTDLAVFRPSTGLWAIRQSSNGLVKMVTFGLGTDKPVQGDYDGDGETDIAVYRPSTGTWYVLRSATATTLIAAWGNSTDVPVTGDFDGDGKTDLTIFRPSTGDWWIFQSLDNTVRAFPFGTNGDIPAAADFDNDGTTDVAVFRPSSGDWYVLRSSTLTLTGVNWGTNGDIPVPKAYLPQ